MNDPIDRQAAIDALDEIESEVADGYGYQYEKWRKYFCELPSAQPEPCGDVVSRNAIIQKLNTMDRYVSEELRLCDTDKKFPQNEVFIVDDVYEEIVEQLPSAQPDPDEWCHDCKEYDKERHCCPRWNRVIRQTLKDAQPEIIHCGECKYYHDSDGCFFSTATTRADGFCHWAERKEGEGDEAD